MNSNQDNIMEAHLRKAARRAWRKLLKNIESEPATLVIESDNTQADTSEAASAEIRQLLFKRR